MVLDAGTGCEVGLAVWLAVWGSSAGRVEGKGRALLDCFQMRGKSAALGSVSPVRSFLTFLIGLAKVRVMGRVSVFRPTELPPPVELPWISGLRVRQTMVRGAFVQ